MMHSEREGRAKARALLARTGHAPVGGHFTKKAHADAIQDKRLITDEIKKAVKQHDDQLHHGAKTRLHLADGGSAEGPMAVDRADKAPRGKGKGGPHNRIAIIIAPQAGQGQPPARPVPVPVPPPAGARPPMAPPPGPPPPGVMHPPGAMPPRPPMPMPGAMPPGAGGPMAGMPPMMRKSGGRTKLENLGMRHGHAESHAADMPGSAQYHGERQPMKRERREQEFETGEAQNRRFAPDQDDKERGKHAKGGNTGPGRVSRMRAGSGSGEGRLEKSEDLSYCDGGRPR